MGHARAAKHAAVKRATHARLRPPYISPVLRNTVMPIAAENIAAEPGVRDYVQVQLTLFASLFSPHLLEQMQPQLEESRERKEKEQ